MPSSRVPSSQRALVWVLSMVAILAPAIGIARPQSTNVEALGGAERLTKPIDAKRWLLWSTLVLGVLVLGGMAWRLSKQLDSSAPAVDATSHRHDD